MYRLSNKRFSEFGIQGFEIQSDPESITKNIQSRTLKNGGKLCAFSFDNFLQEKNV